MSYLQRLAFRMEQEERDLLLNRHLTLSHQLRTRLLSQFDDIDGEAGEVYCETMIAGLSEVDDDRFTEFDLLERADAVSGSFHDALSQTRRDAHLVIATGLYHLLEKSLKEWIDWKMHVQRMPMRMRNNILGAHKFDQVVDFLSLFMKGSAPWDVRSEPCFRGIDRCRLAVNAYKHGGGPSAGNLEKYHPDLFYGSSSASSRNVWKMLDPEYVRIETVHLDEFSDAIEGFWKAMPEELILPNPKPVLPGWLIKGV